MKTIKRSILFLLTLVVAFSLTACLSEKHTVNITSKGGTLLHEQEIPKEVYNELLSMGSDLEEIKAKGYEIEFYTKDDVEYVKASKKYKFDNFESLERYFTELATSNEGANSEKYFKSFNIKSKASNIIISGEIGKPDASATYTSCEIIFNFNDKIVKHSIGEKQDANTLKLDLMYLWKNKSGEEFIIEAGNTNYGFVFIIIGIILLAVVVAVALIIVFKKKKIIK